MVRTAVLDALVVGLLTACASGLGTPAQSPAPSACAAGYSAQSPVIDLAVTDNGRSITASLCDVIWVTLGGGLSGGWQSVETSDPTILALVPLPLPHPPDGGTEAVFLAKHVGVAALSAAGLSVPCAPIANCPTPANWAVTVTVASAGASAPAARVRADPTSADVLQFGGLNDVPPLSLKKSAHITDTAQLNPLVRLLNNLPPFPSSPINCPMDDSSHFELNFQYSDRTAESVRLDETGCEGLYLNGSPKAEAWAASSPGVDSAIAGLLDGGGANVSPSGSQAADLPGRRVALEPSA